MTFYQKYKWLTPLIVFNMVLVLIRVMLTETITFLFLPWNLFLGVLPLYFSFMIVRANSRVAKVGFLMLWLLFFPNAMYIVTDLFHLAEFPRMPQWYDLLLLFSTALNGLILGFLSLPPVEQYLRGFLRAKHTRWLIMSAFLLCGYGIYLGRYLRWNSWDIISNPIALLKDIKHDVVHPLQNFECWMLSAFFGTWLYILYRYCKRIAMRQQA